MILDKLRIVILIKADLKHIMRMHSSDEKEKQIEMIIDF